MKVAAIAQIILIGGVMSFADMTAQDYETSPLIRPDWISTPKQQIQVGSDTVAPSIRMERASFFDLPATFNKSLYDLTNSDNKNQSTGGSYELSQPKALPIISSDVIAYGAITSFQPFLSHDRTRIYSELRFESRGVLKDKTHSLPGTVITILQQGGTLTLPDGRVVSSSPFSGESPLRMNKKYLLFLNYVSKAQAYTVVKAWYLPDGSPVELDNDGVPKKGAGTSDTSGVPTDTESLFAAIKNQISQE